jgi:hypothetical protein
LARAAAGASGAHWQVVSGTMHSSVVTQTPLAKSIVVAQKIQLSAM